jgi:hypothetical protein
MKVNLFLFFTKYRSCDNSKMGWSGHVARIVDMRSEYDALVGGM